MVPAAGGAGDGAAVPAAASSTAASAAAERRFGTGSLPEMERAGRALRAFARCGKDPSNIGTDERARQGSIRLPAEAGQCHTLPAAARALSESALRHAD